MGIALCNLCGDATVVPEESLAILGALTEQVRTAAHLFNKRDAADIREAFNAKPGLPAGCLLDILPRDAEPSAVGNDDLPAGWSVHAAPDGQKFYHHKDHG